MQRQTSSSQEIEPETAPDIIGMMAEVLGFDGRPQPAVRGQIPQLLINLSWTDPGSFGLFADDYYFDPTEHEGEESDFMDFFQLLVCFF